MKPYLRLILLSVAFIIFMARALSVHAQTNDIQLPYYLKPRYDCPLPAGVPRTVETNGNVIYVPRRFTTKLYRDAAVQLMLEEANRVAADLKLTEELPITQANAEIYISPFGFAFAHRMIGTVTAKDYSYYVSADDKFCFLQGTHQLSDAKKFLAEFIWPVARIDTNAAYQLATQYLEAAHMNVAKLNCDCRITINVDTAYVQAPANRFVPIYFVSWIPKNGEAPCAADVRVFTPTKILMALEVQDPKYIDRKPLVFTNLSSLFPGTAPVYTNYPIKTIYKSAPPP